MTEGKIDVAKVITANIVAGLMTLGDMKDVMSAIGENLQSALSIVSLILAISYTVWKWRNDILKKKANIKKHNDAR